MIVSASRRTDIPAFYAQWFINRVRDGYCTVPNPFNKTQVARVSLLRNDVDVIVFWTRNPEPLMPHLKELEAKGYRFYFHYTITGYPRLIDIRSPCLESALAAFRRLADEIGTARVIWRYDPILFGNMTDLKYHAERFAEIARSLRGFTRRCVVSLADPYPKAERRLQRLARQGVHFFRADEAHLDTIGALMEILAQSARENGMEVFSCAERFNFSKHGVLPGKCIDDDLIESLFGIRLAIKKDASQRKECGCVVSKDIGVYNTCLFGCPFCYATTSFKQARKKFESHHPDAPSLADWLEAGAGNDGLRSVQSS